MLYFLNTVTTEVLRTRTTNSGSSLCRHLMLPKACLMSALRCPSGLGMWFKVGHRAISPILRGTRHGRNRGGHAPLGHCGHSQSPELTLESLAQGPEVLLVSSHEISPVHSLMYVFMEIIG